MHILEPTISLAHIRRGRRGWSQRDLAAAAGIPVSTISLAESGRYRLPASARQAIARALGLSADEVRRVKELAP